jgi:hypothetical protein
VPFRIIEIRLDTQAEAGPSVECHFVGLLGAEVKARAVSDAARRCLVIAAVDQSSPRYVVEGFELTEPVNPNDVRLQLARCFTELGWGPELADADHGWEPPAESLMLVLAGGVHGIQPVDVVPTVRLAHWQVYELPDGDRHLVGYNIDDREGRTSGRVLSLDALTASLRTRSGRCYELVGPPGSDPDARYVWNDWLSLNRVPVAEVKRVTDEVWAAIEGARSPAGAGDQDA